MIELYTVTLNPVIDLIYQVPNFEKGSTFRCREYDRMPAGKGLNVSYALSYLGAESTAHIVLGEEDLPSYQRECRRHKIRLRPFAGDFSVRRHCTLLESDPPSVTHVQTAGVPVPADAVEALFDDLVHRVNMEDIVILSGSLPPGAPGDLYARIVSRCKQRGATAVLDTSGEPLRLGIEAHPMVVKVNQGEAEELTGRKIATPQDEYGILQALRRLSKSHLVVITLGGKGMIAGCEQGVWRMGIRLDPSQVKDTVGCGDSFTAGLVYGFAREMGLFDSLRHAVACATSSALRVGPAQLDPNTVSSLLDRIETSNLGSL